MSLRSSEIRQPTLYKGVAYGLLESVGYCRIYAGSAPSTRVLVEWAIAQSKKRDTKWIPKKTTDII